MNVGMLWFDNSQIHPPGQDPESHGVLLQKIRPQTGSVPGPSQHAGEGAIPGGRGRPDGPSLPAG